MSSKEIVQQLFATRHEEPESDGRANHDNSALTTPVPHLRREAPQTGRLSPS